MREKLFVYKVKKVIKPGFKNRTNFVDKVKKTLKKTKYENLHKAL